MDETCTHKVPANTQGGGDLMHSLLGDNPTIWVFGYGSLLWKPDISYKSKRIGFIEGYERRFHQGSVTFRGSPGKPGRVANLVENKDSRTWGVAYEISGQQEVTTVLKALFARETASGGYTALVTSFYPREALTSVNSRSPIVKGGQQYTHHEHERNACHSHNVTPTSSTQAEGGVADHKFIRGLTADDVRRLFRKPDKDWDVPAEHREQSLPDSANLDSDSGTDLCVSNSGAADTEEEGKETKQGRNLLRENVSIQDTDGINKYNRPSYSNVQSSVIENEELLASSSLQTSAQTTAEHIPNTSTNTSLSNQEHSLLTTSHKQGQPAPLKDSYSVKDCTNCDLSKKTSFDISMCSVQALVYTATPDNDLYLGPDDIGSMAVQIVSARGNAGTNIEYVTRTADYIRQHIPEDNDVHLFSLDTKVRELVYRKYSLTSQSRLLGDLSLISQHSDLDHDLPTGDRAVVSLVL